MLPCVIIAWWLLHSKCAYFYANSVFQRYQCSNLQQMKLQVYTSCSCFSCYFGFFTACKFLSCTAPNRRLCRLSINLVLLIALGFFILLTLVCRRLSKDVSVGRIGCTQLLRQCPRHGDVGVSSIQIVHFVLVCSRCSSTSCRLLGFHWELWVGPGLTVHWLLIPSIRL